MKQKLLAMFVWIVKLISNLTGKKNAPIILAHLAENLTPTVSQDTAFGTLYFYCPGKLTEWRAQTLLTKEPDTIQWINGFEDKDVFWDIGANVGVYTLYAAVRNIRVIAFEPGAANYYVLNRNLEINKFDRIVSALCIALDDNTTLDTLYMSRTDYGGALHSFAAPIDWHGKEYSAAFQQSAVGFRIDDFVHQFNPPFPTHMKIDVDGNESKLILGARKTLTDSRLRSILIELNEQRVEDRKTKVSIQESGFILDQKRRVTENEKSEFFHVYNCIFRRANTTQKDECI